MQDVVNVTEDMGPCPAEQRVLLETLRAQRAHVLIALDGLSKEALLRGLRVQAAVVRVCRASKVAGAMLPRAECLRRGL